jgi:AraC family L-rhamnose operon transcriptional activator RhaR
MFWLDRLNSGLNRLQIGGGRVEILGWAHDEHLVDNRPHRHTYFEACLVGRHGAGFFREPAGEHLLLPGTVFVARPGVVHNIVNTSMPLMELFWVSFGWSSDERTPRSDGERAMRAFAESEICAARDQTALLMLWEALKQNAAGNWSVGSVDQTTSLLKAVILGIAQALSPSESVEIPEYITRPGRLASTQAVRYIEDNLNRQLSLEEIASHVNVSTRQLTRLFSTFAGTSPAQYVRVTRLDRASALITKTELSIKEVARQVGFSDVQYFTRCFTSHFGVSPGAFRQGIRTGRKIQRPGMLI